jgi:hypothetical protein
LRSDAARRRLSSGDFRVAVTSIPDAENVVVKAWRRFAAIVTVFPVTVMPA